MLDKINELLADLDIPNRKIKHDAVFTVSESQGLLADKVPVKSLMLKEKGDGRKFLVIVPGEEKLDIKNLEQVVGSKKLSFAKPEVLLETLGVTPGSVSLFCLMHEGATNIEVVVAQQLLNKDEIGFHPFDNTATIFIPGISIEKIIDHIGNKYHLL